MNVTAGKNLVRAGTRADWRKWLARNHASAKEAWLVYSKVHTGRPSVRYDEAVEEALCFGWIDGIVKRIDEQSHMQRFTPRTNTKNWSASNLDRFERMEAGGLMTDAGRAVKSDVILPPRQRVQSGEAPPDFFVKALRKNQRAKRNFDALAPGYRRDYIRYVTEAKREETRMRRLELAIRKLAAGEKLVIG